MRKEQKYDCHNSWGNLSSKPRNHNLAKIKIGSFERSVSGNITLPTKIDKDTLEEKNMGSPKKITGMCDTCGTGPKSLSAHFGKNVCSTCLPIRIGAKNNPDVVIASLAEFGNMPDVLIDEKQAGGGPYVEECRKNEELRRQLNEMKDENADLAHEIADMNIEVETLKEKTMASVSSGDFLDATGKSILNNLVWAVAEGIMDGKITGIKVDDLRAMRSLL